MPGKDPPVQDNQSKTRRILVDADACPVIQEIITLASERDWEVCLVSNICHEYSPGEKVKVMTVDKSPQAADLALYNYSRPGDVVVTQDYGLACMVLPKGVGAISPRGKIFTEDNIEGLMNLRHIARKERKRGNLKGGPPPFSEKDRKRFLRNLLKLIS